jgi:hypothetical protein
MKGKGQPPHQEYISCVGIIENSKVELKTIQKDESFTTYDAQEGVIALAWESYEGIDPQYQPGKRLVFHYGDTEKSVKDKLYSRDMDLKIKKI